MNGEVVVELLVDKALALAVNGEILEIESWPEARSGGGECGS